MGMNEQFYKAELRSIDALREFEGGWTWNASYTLGNPIMFREDGITTRQILKALRQLNYLSDYSKGKMRVEDAWPIIEIQMRGTHEPVFALMFDEERI